MEELTVSLPADMIAAMRSVAADRGVTVDDLVREAFRYIGNRVDPEIHVN